MTNEEINITYGKTIEEMTAQEIITNNLEDEWIRRMNEQRWFEEEE